MRGLASLGANGSRRRLDSRLFDRLTAAGAYARFVRLCTRLEDRPPRLQLRPLVQFNIGHVGQRRRRQSATLSFSTASFTPAR